MKRMVFFFGLLTLLLLAACGGSSGPVKIDSITLSKGDGSGNAGETVTSFSPADHDFHAAVKFENLASGSKVTYIWVAVNAGGATNQKLWEKELVTDEENLRADFSLSNSNNKLFPAGDYKIDIYLDDELIDTVRYKVQ